MNNLTLMTLAAACAASPLLAQPTHAQSQWVASMPVPVAGHLLDIESGANGGNGDGSPGDPGVSGTGGGAGNFDATSHSFGSSNAASSDYEFGNQWQITYTWTGSGTPGYPILVNVTEDADGVSQGTMPATGGSSSSAQGGDSKSNSTNPPSLGGSCVVGGNNYYDSYKKPESSTFVQLPMQDGPNPVIVVTIAAKSSGQCIQSPPGTTTNWGSYNTQSHSSVVVNSPQ